MTATLDATPTLERTRVRAASARLPRALEAIALLAAPGVLYGVLQLRAMGPPKLPDPSMHTTFILDPHAIFDRFSVLFTPSARLREAARVGFLVPARLSEELFGAVPGFFVFRYVLALVAIVPLYLLLKRLHGRWAGALGIAVVMSSPVFVTAWGTDYPDSATISYLTGGLAALALSWDSGPWQSRWVLIAGALMTLALWSLGVSAPLLGAMLVAHLGLRLIRQRERLALDIGLLAGSAVVLTFLLAVASKLLIGQFDFISPTIKSAQVLSAPVYVNGNHSSNWRWVLYVPYLLVPPAVAAAFWVVIGRRLSGIDPIKLFVGIAGLLELGVCAAVQFGGSVQTLEMPYFSSALWSSVVIMTAICLAEIWQAVQVRASRAPVAGWISAAIPALLVIGVALLYEAHPHVRQMTWPRAGIVVALIAVAAAAVGRLVLEWRRRADPGSGWPAPVISGAISGAALAVVTGATLALTVAPSFAHKPLAHTVYDPVPAYADALGGDATYWIGIYTADSQIPGFVGPPAYKGEPLMTWEPKAQFGNLLGPMGLYHNAFTWVSQSFPVLSAEGAHKIEDWRTGQVLLMSQTGAHFAQAVRSLARFDPAVVRTRVLSHGGFTLHVWLVELRRFTRSA